MIKKYNTVQEAINDELVGYDTEFYIYRQNDAYVIVRGYSVKEQCRADDLDEVILHRLMKDKCPRGTFVEKVPCADIKYLRHYNATIFQYVGPNYCGDDASIPWGVEPVEDYYVFIEEPSEDVNGWYNFVVVTTERRTFLGEKFFRELGKLIPTDHRFEIYGTYRDQNPSEINSLLKAELQFGEFLKAGGRFFNWDGETLDEKKNMNGGNV